MTVCGIKSDHEHNDEGLAIEFFGGGYKVGAKKDFTEEELKKAQMVSVACSICGSSAFERHAATGFADDWED